MSRNSKAKRDARRKKLAKRSYLGRTSRQIEPHGEMRDENGRVIAGIGRQGDEWVLVIGNQVMGGGASAADVMVMFHHLADIHQRDGGSVFNSYSTTFKAEAERDAAEQGMSLSEYIERARDEMAESDSDRSSEEAH